MSVSQRKFDSPCFSEQWNHFAQIRNVEERGGPLFTDLRKLVCSKHLDGTISLSFNIKTLWSVN